MRRILDFLELVFVIIPILILKWLLSLKKDNREWFEYYEI